MKAVIAALAIITVGLTSRAEFGSVSDNGRYIDVLSDTSSPQESSTQSHSSGTFINRVILANAQMPAIQVLKGEAGNELFLRARAVTEQILEQKFSTDEEAALAILELAQTLK